MPASSASPPARIKGDRSLQWKQSHMEQKSAESWQAKNNNEYPSIKIGIAMKRTSVKYT